jgi:hypothetical protein
MSRFDRRTGARCCVGALAALAILFASQAAAAGDDRVLTAGCYGFEIDGTAFSRIVVVRVDVAR